MSYCVPWAPGTLDRQTDTPLFVCVGLWGCKLFLVEYDFFLIKVLLRGGRHVPNEVDK